MALSGSGFGEKSAERFVIDSGVIYKNLKFTDGEFSGDLLGATQGGVEINIEKKYRKIEVDGAFVMDVKGLNVVDSEQATFTATLIELSANQLAMSAGGTVAESTDYAGYQVVEGKYTVEEGDYIDNMAIVGTLAGNGKNIIFIFDNVLITSALKLKMEDQKEAGNELTGQANASYDQLQNRKSPWHILYPDESSDDGTVPVTGVNITSTAVAGKVGDDLTLSAEVLPANATNQNFVWESSDKTVADFTKVGASQGSKILTLLKVGTTTVTVKSEDGTKTDTVLITVSAA